MGQKKPVILVVWRYDAEYNAGTGSPQHLLQDIYGSGRKCLAQRVLPVSIFSTSVPQFSLIGLLQLGPSNTELFRETGGLYVP